MYVSQSIRDETEALMGLETASRPKRRDRDISKCRLQRRFCMLAGPKSVLNAVMFMYTTIIIVSLLIITIVVIVVVVVVCRQKNKTGATYIQHSPAYSTDNSCQ